MLILRPSMVASATNLSICFMVIGHQDGMVLAKSAAITRHTPPRDSCQVRRFDDPIGYWFKRRTSRSTSHFRAMSQSRLCCCARAT